MNTSPQRPWVPIPTAAAYKTVSTKPGSTDAGWVGVGALNGECLSHQGKWSLSRTTLA
jgi:hypothetical protein